MVQLHKRQCELHKKGGKRAFHLHINSFLCLFFMSSQTAARRRKHGLSPLMFVLQDLVRFTCALPETATLVKRKGASNFNDLPGSFYSIFCMNDASGRNGAPSSLKHCRAGSNFSPQLDVTKPQSSRRRKILLLRSGTSGSFFHLD